MVIAIGLFYLTKEKVEVLGAVIATGISLSIGIRQSKTENDKLFKGCFKTRGVSYNSCRDFISLYSCWNLLVLSSSFLCYIIVIWSVDRKICAE